MIVSGERRRLACGVWQPAKHNIVGKLLTIAGWQPALPGSARPAETARDPLLFFESTLHVPPDQQLSALQPLTK
jgi:hypothetical protein